MQAARDACVCSSRFCLPLRTHNTQHNTLTTTQTYVLKLAKSGEDGEKVFLLLESGTRFHTVQVRDRAAAASDGCMCAHA